MSTESRAKGVVNFLMSDAGISPKEAADLSTNGRVKQLGGMLMRHGLLQVTAFLARPRDKGEARGVDTRLLKLLERTMQKAHGQAPGGQDGIALNLRYLSSANSLPTSYLQTLALECALWIERVVEAKQVVEPKQVVEAERP